MTASSLKNKLRNIAKLVLQKIGMQNNPADTAVAVIKDYKESYSFQNTFHSLLGEVLAEIFDPVEFYSQVSADERFNNAIRP